MRCKGVVESNRRAEKPRTGIACNSFIDGIGIYSFTLPRISVFGNALLANRGFDVLGRSAEPVPNDTQRGD